MGKKNKAKGKKSQDEEGKRDLSKIKFFHCGKHGNYALNYPQKKASKKELAIAAGEALASQFELDFTLIACMANTARGCMWYLDNDASLHLMGNRDLFSDLEEKDLQQNIEFGDEGRYSVTGIGKGSF